MLQTPLLKDINWEQIEEIVVEDYVEAEPEGSIWDRIRNAYAESDAAKDNAELITLEDTPGVKHFDLSTPTTVDRVNLFFYCINLIAGLRFTVGGLELHY